jgi:hypothetical protein
MSAHPNRALIINENEPLDGIEGVRILLKSIFRRATLDAGLENLAATLAERADWLASPLACAAGLRDSLLGLARDPGQAGAEARELLAAVLEHERETGANAIAYTAHGKTNPNAMFWPNPTAQENPRSIYDELPYANTFDLIDRHTPVGSAGSCFAMEIAHRLQHEGYNYVITEPDANPKNGYSNSCARWGTIFNVPCFRQLVEKAFGERTLPRILWSMRKNGKIELRDPFREEIIFDSVEQYEADYARHLAAAREALLAVDVFVITLGVNEVWYLRADGTVFSRNPWRLSSSLVERRVLTVEDNVRELERMLTLWRHHNPRLKLIVSVSPVPMLATFRGADMHVAAATCHSKSTLRLAAEAFAQRQRDVYYFPSFEKVMYCTRDPWDRDQRHVARHTVDGVMRLFDTMFVRRQPATQAVPAPAPVAEANAPDTERFNLLAVVRDTTALGDLETLVSAYAATFKPNQPVQLILWLPDPAGHSVATAQTHVANGLRAAGQDPAHCAGIQILHDVPLSRHDELFARVQALVVLDPTHDAALYEAARRHQVRALPATAEALQLAAQDWHELLLARRGLAELKAQPALAAQAPLLDRIAEGYGHYYATLETPHAAYHAMRAEFCADAGITNEVLRSACALAHPPRHERPAHNATLLNGSDPQVLVTTLRQDGYCQLPVRLSAEACDRLLWFATTTPSHPRFDLHRREEKVVFDPARPLSVRYDFDEADVMAQPDVQRLATDLGLLGLAEAYLGCDPILDLVSMWWSAARPADAALTSAAAQQYHFDLDRPGFIKFFIYLTDVTSETGPHCYVRGSHRNLPPPLRRDGRLSDDEVAAVYDARDRIEISAPRGSVLAVDTIGLHKGKTLVHGVRLILQLEFASNLYGAPYRMLSGKVPGDAAFAAALRRRPRTYQRFI